MHHIFKFKDQRLVVWCSDGRINFW